MEMTVRRIPEPFLPLWWWHSHSLPDGEAKGWWWYSERLHYQTVSTCYQWDPRHSLSTGSILPKYAPRPQNGVHTSWMDQNQVMKVLGLVPLNPIVWCYVCYYVWLNVVINKISLLSSKMMVTWIFGHYHIVHEMHSMWFMWKVTEDINRKFFVNS